MSLLKSASTVSFFTLLSRILGLGRELIVAAFFGANAMTDAFNVAFRIPNLLRRIFAEGAFSQAFVPILAESKTREGEAATKTLIDHVATILFWSVLATCAVGVAAASYIVWAMASGLAKNPTSFDAAIGMTRIMFPYILCMAGAAMASAVLNTWRQFAIPAASPILLNVAVIAAAWFGAPYLAENGVQPIYALAIGVMIGGFLQIGIQLWALHKIAMFPRIGFTWWQIKQAFKNEKTGRMLKLMAAALVGVSVSQISLLINTQIASHLVEGSVSWLSYADRLMEFPVAILGVALSVVLMPQLASAKAAGEHQRYSDMIDWGLRLVFLLGLPCSVALFVFAEPLVASLFQRGAFHASDTAQTTLALRGYGIGLMGLLAVKILAPAFYASQNVKTPVKIAIGVLIATQILNLLFVPYFNHAGLALSIGLGAILNASWLFWGLLKRKSYTPCAGWVGFLLRLVLSNALLAAFMWWAANYLNWTDRSIGEIQRFAYLFAALAIAAALYFGTLIAMRVNLKAMLRGPKS